MPTIICWVGWIGQIKRHIHTQFNKKDLKYGMCIYYTKGKMVNWHHYHFVQNLYLKLLKSVERILKTYHQGGWISTADYPFWLFEH